MKVYQTSLERAFELARSGSFSTTPDIGKQMTREGYPKTSLQGPQLQRQLRKAIAEARRRFDSSPG